MTKIKSKLAACDKAEALYVKRVILAARRIDEEKMNITDTKKMIVAKLLTDIKRASKPKDFKTFYTKLTKYVGEQNV